MVTLEEKKRRKPKRSPMRNAIAKAYLNAKNPSSGLTCKEIYDNGDFSYLKNVSEKDVIHKIRSFVTDSRKKMVKKGKKEQEGQKFIMLKDPKEFLKEFNSNFDIKSKEKITTDQESDKDYEDESDSDEEQQKKRKKSNNKKEKQIKETKQEEYEVEEDFQNPIEYTISERRSKTRKDYNEDLFDQELETKTEEFIESNEKIQSNQKRKRGRPRKNEDKKQETTPSEETKSNDSSEYDPTKELFFSNFARYNDENFEPKMDPSFEDINITKEIKKFKAKDIQSKTKNLDQWNLDFKNNEAYERYCFICKRSIIIGESFKCSYSNCPKWFHNSCVEDDISKNYEYYCPSHYCNQCGVELHEEICNLKICVKNYCKKHKNLHVCQ